jgi:hypothetical protein
MIVITFFMNVASLTGLKPIVFLFLLLHLALKGEAIDALAFPTPFHYPALQGRDKDVIFCRL